MPDTKVEQPAPQGNTIYDRALNDGEPVDNGDCALDKPCVICRQHGNQISIEINNEHPLKLSFDTAEDLWQALDAYLQTPAIRQHNSVREREYNPNGLLSNLVKAELRNIWRTCKNGLNSNGAMWVGHAISHASLLECFRLGWARRINPTSDYCTLTEAGLEQGRDDSPAPNGRQEPSINYSSPNAIFDGPIYNTWSSR
jgi:hypothetical protein